MAKELIGASGGKIPLQAWDNNESVTQAGKVAASLTLMQGLAAAPADPSFRVDALKKTMKGLAILGRGLMEGHTAVVARANATLASAAAAAAQPAPQPPSSSGGPPARAAKKLKKVVV